DANYRVPWFVIFGWSKAYTLPEWTLIGPVLARQSLFDDRHVRRVFRVCIVEVAARQQRHAHRAKVVRLDYRVLNRRRLASGSHWITFDRQTAAPVAPSQRQRA